jgi:hypothetical protein
MGVDTQIHLPYSAQARHITQVIGILAGLPKTHDVHGYLEVQGAKLCPGTDFSPDILTIKLNSQEPMVDGETEHFCLLFMESTTDRGKLLMPRSTPFWIAVGRELVDFFGGSMLYQDDSSHEVDYFRPSRDNTTEGRLDESNFYEMQKRIESVKPLTVQNLHDASKFAPYKDLPERENNNVYC